MIRFFVVSNQMKKVIVLLLVGMSVAIEGVANIKDGIPVVTQPHQPSTKNTKENNRSIVPSVQLISIDDRYLYPSGLPDPSQNCFGPKKLVIQPGNTIRIVANLPFVVFFRTQTAHTYYLLLKQPEQSLNNILLTNIFQSQPKGQLEEVQIPLNISCSFLHRDIPHLKMKGKLHVDFKEGAHQGGIDFNFLLVCATSQTVKQFDEYYKYIYAVFWVYCNLILMIYHGYPRDRSHFVMMLLYIFSSVMIEQRMTGYIIAGILFIMVLIREKKNNQLNTKVFSLYLFFLLFLLLLIIFSYESENNSGNQWNIFSIALDNFVQTHITMFMILRLVKVSRLRHVFWYFVAVAAFALLYQGNPNRYFQLTFQNVYNLQCLTLDMFFPFMMLPVSNYFASMTWWMHRILGFAICIACVLPLAWAIKFMAIVIVGVMVYEIRKNSIDAIKHRF